MSNPFPNRRRKINLETWERATVFNFFHRFPEPFHGVCVRMDCTATYAHAKQRGISVSLSLLHRALAAAQQVENLHTQLAAGELWRYEIIHGGCAVGRPNGTIGFAVFPYVEELEAFVAAASPEVERVRQRQDLERYPESDLIRFSTLPWLDFTSLSHARDFAQNDSAPRITLGKISEHEGRRTMPVSIHVHHGLMDGLHVGQFVEAFQEMLHHPSRLAHAGCGAAE